MHTRNEIRLGRRQWLASVAAMGACALLPQTVHAAAGVDYQCDWRAAFAPDPSKKQRFGYLTSLRMLKAPDLLAEDLEVFCPFTGPTRYSGFNRQDDGPSSVAGVLASLSWAGGVGDPICISAYVSAANAQKLRQKMKSSPASKSVEGLGYWVANHDAERKQWFEEAFPLDPALLVGQINAPGGKELRLTIAEEPTQAGPNIDLNLYGLHLEVIPAMNSNCALHFATSAQPQFVRNWGLKVGKAAAASMGG